MREWPNREDYVITPANNDRGDPEFADDERYERARAEAALSRLRVAVEALAVLRPALWLDLRYASDDDDKDALLSRASGVDEALSSIGPLPPPPSTGSGE